MGAVFAGDTLTLQIQGNAPGFTSTFTLGFGGAGTDADEVAQYISQQMNGQGFAINDIQDNTNTDGTIFVQMDVTAGQDFGDSNDVLSIANHFYYEATGSIPNQSSVTDINGVSLTAGVTSSGKTSIAGAVTNPGAVASSIGTNIIAPVTNQLDAFIAGLKSFGTTALVLVAIIIIVAILVLTTSGGQGAARLFL